MKVKNYFDIVLTNPHIGCMRKRFYFLSARISSIIEKVHHGDGPVVPFTIIVCRKRMTVCQAGASKEMDK
jgi:hypothetical protein